MDLKKIQKLVDQWIKNHGIRYFDELTNWSGLVKSLCQKIRIKNQTRSRSTPQQP